MLDSKHICSKLIPNLQWHLSGTLGHPDFLLRWSNSSGSAGWKNNLSEENLNSATQRERYSGHVKNLTLHMQGIKYAEDSESLHGGLRQLTTQSLNTGQPLPQPLPCDKQQTWTPKSEVMERVLMPNGDQRGVPLCSSS